MPESLHESSVDLRLRECKYCIPNLSNVNLKAPNINNTVSNSFGISNKVCYFWINYRDAREWKNGGIFNVIIKALNDVMISRI